MESGSATVGKFLTSSYTKVASAGQGIGTSVGLGMQQCVPPALCAASHLHTRTSWSVQLLSDLGLVLRQPTYSLASVTSNDLGGVETKTVS